MSSAFILSSNIFQAFSLSSLELSLTPVESFKGITESQVFTFQLLKSKDIKEGYHRARNSYK